MAPKKKERDGDGVKIRSSEQTDHEIFLQAFEKPTQIYRYLRTRNMITPIFLYRNLSYMKDRIKRTNKSRSTFKADCLLSKKVNEKINGCSTDKTLGEYMTLMFLGFFDKNLPDDEVEVETYLSKISHKKRKDSFKTLQERFGTSVVKINPDDSTSNGKIPAVSVPADNFKTPDESLHLSYKLQLNVKVLDKFTSVDEAARRLTIDSNTDSESTANSVENGKTCIVRFRHHEFMFERRIYLSYDKPESEFNRLASSPIKNENSAKKICLLPDLNNNLIEATKRNLKTNASRIGGVVELTSIFDEFLKNIPTEDLINLGWNIDFNCDQNLLDKIEIDTRHRLSDEKSEWKKLQIGRICGTVFKDDTLEPLPKRHKSQIIYESELLVFDKQKRRLLSDGEYEVSLQERLQPTKNSPKKLPGWEVIPDTFIDSLEKNNHTFDDFQKCPKLKFRLAWTKEKLGDLVDRPSAICSKKDESNKENQPDQNHNGATDIVKAADKLQIIYQFIYNNNSRQQMEPCENFCCIWCSLDCMGLYSLLKHLKLCHARFNFKYVPSPPAVRIDISINELYDGSPHDLIGSSSFAFSRAGPVRRTTVTRILVCRPRRVKPNLTEFLEIDENELNSQRPFITGHSRLYHHTMTCLPVHPKELDIESEDENDPVWLQQKTKMMIDEFTDVNEGEKEMMKMWNIHIMRHGYVGDIQIPLACEMFIEKRGEELLQKNLYKNFVMHMCNLFDYGVVSPEVYYKTIQKLQRLLSNHDVGRKVIIEAREQQVDYWQKVGLQKQKVQQLEQQKKNQISVKGPTTSSEKASISVEKPIKKETKTKLDEKLLTAVVTLKSSKNGVTNPPAKKRESDNQNKEDTSSIKRRRTTLRESSRHHRNNGTRTATKLLPPSRRST